VEYGPSALLFYRSVNHWMITMMITH